MAFNFQRGDLCPVVWSPTGFASSTLNIRDHSLDLVSALFDVTSTGSQGLTARLAGKGDSSATINADLDLDQPTWGPLVIQPGVRGVMVFYQSPTKGIQVPKSIEKVHYQVGVDSQVKYSFDAKMNQLAGLFIYPSFP